MFPLLPHDSLPGPESPSAPSPRASRLDVQRHALESERMHHLASTAGHAEPGEAFTVATAADGRIARRVGRLRETVGTMLIATGERIRPYPAGAAPRGTHGQ